MTESQNIPPALLHIDLRMRCRFNTLAWTFRRYAPVAYQLDSALLMFNEDERDAAFEDAVGSK